MSNYDWVDSFHQCYDHAVTAYRLGNRQPETYFNPAERDFLASIGCSAQEVYDFAEDWCRDEAPAFVTALLVTAARRDYFHVIQQGRRTGRTISVNDLPAKDAELAGYAWLLRIIAKARAKLRGELPDELMYCCGGDRAFLRKVNIHPADFLREIWAARDDDQKIVDYVKAHAAQ